MWNQCNFPLYWYQPSFSHEMNWVVHRSFSHHVFSQNVECPSAFCCELTVLYSFSLVEFLYSLMHAWVVCFEEGYYAACTIAKKNCLWSILSWYTVKIEPRDLPPYSISFRFILALTQYSCVKTPCVWSVLSRITHIQVAVFCISMQVHPV